MQIPCKRFGCQKAVEVCYWSCKFRKNCKDWQLALAQEPGAAAIQTRLEAAAAKSGRVFDALTLDPATAPQKKSRKQARSLPATVSNSPRNADVAPLVVKATKQRTASASLSARRPRPAPLRMGESVPNNDSASPSNSFEKKRMSEPNETQPKATKASKAPRAKAGTNGPLYLLLQKNGKYRELRESELLPQAALILKDPSLRLVKGQLMIPTIRFQTSDDE